MADKAPKISTHAPKHKQTSEKQPSFIHKKGEQSFFGATQSHATLAAPAFIQPKLQTSKPGDPFEQEADQTADKVTRLSEPSTLSSASIKPPDENVQRKCSTCEEKEKVQKKEEEEVQPKMYVNNSGALVQRMEDEEVQSKMNEDEDQPVQRKEEDEDVQPSLYKRPANIQLQEEEDIQPKVSQLARKDRGPPVISPALEHSLHSNKGSGRTMDSNTRQFMETRFNANFTGVKVHTDTNAVQMTSGINAQAFTHGNNIYFNSGRYNPDTASGRHLLAHELTHTIQQGAAKSVQPFLSTKLNTQAVSEAEQEDVQPSLIVQRKETSAPQVRPELKRAVSYAKSQIGKVDASKKSPDGTRVGWERLTEYYKTVMGEDKVIPEGGVQTPGSILEKDIKYKDTAPAPQANQPATAEWKDRDKMPSWCGIFVFWSLDKGGVPMPKWTLGGGAITLKAAYKPGYIPKPGDIAYFNTNSHYAIVEKTEPENPSPNDRKNVKVLTVNGNTSGEDNLGGQIQVKNHAVTHWDGFFDPLYGLLDKMPKDPAAFTDSEMQEILSNAGTSASSIESPSVAPSAPAEVKAYAPETLSPPGMETPLPGEEKTEEVATVDELTQEGVDDTTMAGKEAKVELPSPKTPEEDPAFQEVIKKSGKAKAAQQVHGTPEEKANAAQMASEIPEDLDKASQAQFHKVSEMSGQQAQPFSKENFKKQLMERVKDALPKNDNETVEMYEDSSGTHKRMEQAKESAKGDVKAEKDKAGNAIATTTEAEPDLSLAKPKETKAMEIEDAGKAPLVPKAETAAPKPKTDSEISMEKDAQELDNEMAKDNVTEAQLEKSNEPSFNEGLQNKKEAQQQARQAPAEYREQEQPQLAKAEDSAKSTVLGKVGEMNNVRSDLFGKVDADKTATKDKDAAKRKEIADNLQRIYTNTKTKVEGILTALEKEVTDEFDKAANAANAEFERRVNKRLDDFYGITTADDTISEWVSGHLDPEIDLIFTQERDRYISTIDASITVIAGKVEKQLRDAMAAITEGKTEIDKYWTSLDPESKKIGEEAKTNILGKFEELEQSVQDKHEELLDKLAEKYKKNIGELQEKFDKIKESKQGLLSGAINAIRAIIKAIKDLAEMLFNTLVRVATVIGDIISDPVGFFGNMVTAVQMGLQNFKDNIVLHLKKGFFEWLLGNMPPSIVFPDKWDLMGIFQFVMSILGITWTNIRMRAVKKLGEPVVSALEEVFEVFQIIRKEGLAGLWNYIKDKVGNLQVMVIDAIQNFLVEKVIKAGIMWVVGLLNPAGAFIKACQAIYKIVMFFIEKGKQIMDFVNTVIDSIANIVAGNLGGAAKMIEDSLARLIPLAIGFLASLLGLDGVSEKVQKIITAIQAPINKAIDWIIDKAIALAKKLGIDKLIKKVKGGIDKGKDWAKKKAQQVKEKGKAFKDKIFNWWKTKKKVTYNGKPHTMYLEGKEGNAKLRMRSTPVTYRQFISDIPATPADKLLLENKADAIDIKLAGYGKVQQENRKQWAEELIVMMNDLAALTEKYAGAEETDPHTVITWGSTTSEAFGSSFNAKLLSTKYVSGQEAEKETKAVYGWDIARGRKMISEAGNPTSVYVKGHLLNGNLGGKANATNLTPITITANNKHKEDVENHVKEIVISNKKVANYEVDVAYNKHPARTSLKENYYKEIRNLEQVKSNFKKRGELTRQIENNINRPIENYTNLVLLLDYEEHNLPTAFVCRWQQMIFDRVKKEWIPDPALREHLVEVPTDLPDEIEAYQLIVKQFTIS